ncbi:MAG TPA: hypothetical protein VFW49_14955 [Fluviicoccus sp.]|nr:hypothetical protein [Fluviicoccus sp.]
MSTKAEFFEKHMQPLIDKLVELADEGNINFVTLTCVEEEGEEHSQLFGACYHDSEKNGFAPHIVAVDKLGHLGPDFAMAVINAAEKREQLNKAIAEQNPHGIAH